MNSGRRKFMMGGIALALAGVLTVVGIATHVNNVKVEAAKNTLPGIEKIISENSAKKPFTILEIVPARTVTVNGVDTDTGQLSIPTGTIGWLISGNEPINLDYTLSQFKSQNGRRDFMSRFQTALKEITTDQPDPTVKPMYMASYNEVIEDLADPAFIASAKRITPASIQSVNSVDMEARNDRSGQYVKTFVNPSVTGSQNTVAKDFFDKNSNSVFVSSNNAGDFDPNFVPISDGGEKWGEYCITLSKNDIGSYIVSAASDEFTIEIGASWNQAEKRHNLNENTCLYQKNGDFFEFKGYLAKNGDYISVNAVPNFQEYTITASNTVMHFLKYYAAENTGSGNNAGEAVPPAATPEPSVPSVTTPEPGVSPDPSQGNPAPPSENPSGEGTSGNSVSGGSVSGNSTTLPGASGNSASDNSASDNSALPGVSANEPAAGTPVSGSQNYYTVTFKYGGADPQGIRYSLSSYRRISENEAPEKKGSGTYGILASEPIVPNYNNTGVIKNDKPSADSICFVRTAVSGNYAVKPGASSVYIKDASFYYTGGYHNNEWFKRYVFDRTEDIEFKKLYMNVYTLEASQINTTDLERADLIYISTRTQNLMPSYNNIPYPNYTKGVNDLSQSAARTILYLAAMRNKPIIVDSKLINKGVTDEDTYAYMVSRMLTSDDIKEGYNNFVATYDLSRLRANKFNGDYDKSYVNNHIYIFNDVFDMNAGHTVVNRNFRTSDDLNSVSKNQGLEEVYENIKEENSKRPDEKKIENIVHEGSCIRYILNQSRMSILATKGDIHILEIEPMELDFSKTDYKYGAYDGRRKIDGINYNNGGDLQLNLKYDLSVKVSGNGTTKTNVLCYTKWDQAIPEELEILETPGNITITRMPTSEFVGKVEDLNSEYDMIFIGDDTSAMNHTTGKDFDKSRWWVKEETNIGTEYNDATMNGLIYSNVGDYIYISRKLMGSLSSDYIDREISYNSDKLVKMTDFHGETNGYDSTVGRTRFSGNDIKAADINRIFDFALADYPVVFGDLLIEKQRNSQGKETGRTVSGQYVDNCSHLYQLMKKLLADKRTNDNVFMMSDIVKISKDKDKKNMFVQSLGTLKPEIKILSPVLSADDGMEVTKSETDDYMINLKFRIDDVGSGDGSSYAGHFYTDMNADGKYAANEELKGAIIRFTDSGGNNVDGGSLSSGVEYRVICRLDSTFVAGVYPWKLSVVQTGDGRQYRRDCVIGYATVPQQEKNTIKVLQITPPNKNDITIDLADAMTRYENNIRNHAAKNTALGYYLSNIPGFKVEISKISSKDFVYAADKRDLYNKGALTADAYLEELRKYDMVIVGFGDSYVWGEKTGTAEMQEKSAEGLLGYMAEGNSVLFSHDTTSYYYVRTAASDYGNYDNQAAASNGFRNFSFNQYVRNVVGMNRYGVASLADTSTNETVRALLKGQIYDTIYQPRSNPTGEEGKGVSIKGSQGHGIAGFTLLRGQIKRGNWADWRNDWMEADDIDLNKNPNRNDFKKWILHYNNHYPSRISNGANHSWGNDQKSEMVTVDRVNRGQITEYPYHLPEKFNVTFTHGQYFQLNLDLDDDKDGESDVVVWYTLGSINSQNNRYLYHNYNMTGKDVRNNYFIYNRGNITYTGQGHYPFYGDNDSYTSSPTEAKDAVECQLLVNTIIASYSAGVRDCEVTFRETGSATSKKMKSDIIPYDIIHEVNPETGELEFPGAAREENPAPGTAGEPIMTTYIDVNDSNIVYAKKIYAKFNIKPNVGLERADIDNTLQPLKVIKVTALNDNGEVATDYRDVNLSYDSSTGEYLLYDSTQEQDLKAVNAGKMFKLEYSLEGFKFDPNGPGTGITVSPGIAVTTRTVLVRKENGLPTEKTAEDDLMLIRTQLFDLK